MEGGGAVLVAGAAMGGAGAFDLLFTSVSEAGKKVFGFTSHLNRLKSTLSSIKPTIEGIQHSSTSSWNVRPRHETEAFTARLIEAESLVRRCSKVRKWNVLMRFYYSKKLGKLEASLLNFFQINVTALHLCETKRIAVVVSHLQEKVNEMANILNKETVVVENDEIRSVAMDE